MTDSLRVIAPATVSDAMLISTNVAEDDASEWDAGTTYALGDRVILAAEHYVYESATASNLGNDPSDGDPSYWIQVRRTRTWRPFDEGLSEAVSNSGTIEYVIEPDTLITAVGLIGAEALYATVNVKNSSGTVLATSTEYLADYSQMVDAISMVTITPGYREKVAFTDAICQPGNQVEVIIGDGTGSPTINEITLGRVVPIGTPLAGVEIGIDDYSTHEEDIYGNVTVTERGYRDFADIPINVDAGYVTQLRKELAALRARMALYFFTTSENDYGTTVYGRYDQLSMTVGSPNSASMNLRLMGVTYGA